MFRLFARADLSSRVGYCWFWDVRFSEVGKKAVFLDSTVDEKWNFTNVSVVLSHTLADFYRAPPADYAAQAWSKRASLSEFRIVGSPDSKKFQLFSDFYHKSLILAAKAYQQWRILKLATSWLMLLGHWLTLNAWLSKYLSILHGLKVFSNILEAEFSNLPGNSDDAGVGDELLAVDYHLALTSEAQQCLAWGAFI